jgi:dihydromonapterin reductase/dihydrofolate reductase
MKNALITGANSYVNKVLLDKLLAMGYAVVAHYHSDNDLTKEIRNKAGVTLLQADFSDQRSVEAFIGAALANGPYDVVVNAAALQAEAGDWKTLQQNYADWCAHFSVNTIVPGLLIARADKLVMDGGVIVNISSSNGEQNFGDRQFAMYSATKAALNSLTATYAKRWSPRIRLVGIAPAYIRSGWNKDMPADELAILVKDHLTQRLVEPEEIANLMELLITNKSINATTTPIDGGYTVPRVPQEL